MGDSWVLEVWSDWGGEIEVSVEFKQPCVVSGYHLAKRGSGAASQWATVLSHFSETSLLLFEWGISKEKYLVYLVSKIDFDWAAAAFAE